MENELTDKKNGVVSVSSNEVPDDINLPIDASASEILDEKEAEMPMEVSPELSFPPSKKTRSAKCPHGCMKKPKCSSSGGKRSKKSKKTMKGGKKSRKSRKSKK